ncbi:MAG: hypothetical protein WB711_23890 [Terriglobales bacterium]
MDDLQALQQLLQLGMGRMVDRSGIDWWDVLSLEIVPQLQQLILAPRLSRELDGSCELYASRPHLIATALQRLLGARLTILENRFQSVIHRARRYRDTLLQIDATQFAQVLVDRFDNDHAIRRRFVRRRQPSAEPVVLLPSAYINVSRIELAYAEQLSEYQFLLVCTRNNANVSELPPNVRSASLTPYFAPSDKLEMASLLESWNGLRKHLAGGDEILNLADAIGLLGQIPSLLRWGLALRDAWSRVFEAENVTACLCADDSNPPSSIPLMMAKKRGLPAIACHHGGLNYHMAIKTNHADVYLVKNEMERDYLRRICNVPPEKMAMAGLPPSKAQPEHRIAPHSAPWLVFFTEPYQCGGWRNDEVYGDLLPRLCALARSCRLKLVFKLHPFDSVKSHRKMLRRFVPEHARMIEVVTGPPSDQLWKNTRIALTVQSSIALECAALGIPVFLCAWLRDPYSGYVPQYARFGVGHVLESPEQIADVPQLLENQKHDPSPREASVRNVDSFRLARLFSAGHTLPPAATDELVQST